MEDALQQYKNDFLTDYKVMEEQRDKANEELRFAMVPGGQWEGWLEDFYEDRAKMELDQASEYLYRTYAQWVDGRIGINYEPADDSTNDEDAEVMDGLWRRDLRYKHGQMAIDGAVFESFACGTGAFHLSTEYEDEEDPEDTDQRVCIEQINNAYSMVAWDTGSRRLDKSDASRCTILYPYTPEAFKQKWPDVDPTSAAHPTDRSWFNWHTPNLVYVACRYEVRKKSTVMHTWANPFTRDITHLTSKELDEERAELTAMGYEEINVKRIQRRNVYKTLFCGSQILEKERRIAGKYIPVIPIYGYRTYVDGIEYYHGLIRKRMDSQRLLNMSASLLAEEAAYSHEAKPIFAPEQVQGLASHWAQNRHQKPYLLAHPIYDENGNITHAGPLGTLDGSRLGQAAQTLIEITSGFIQQGTGGAPQDTIDPDASGKAINAVIKRVDQATRPLFENIAAALTHAAEVYRHIAAEIYAERTRTVMLPNREGAVRSVQLLAQRGAANGIITGNDPSRGKFAVVVDTGPSYETQREETIEALKDIAQGIGPNNPLQQLILAKLIELLPSQGMNDIKDYVHRQLLLAGVSKPETDEDMQILQAASQQAGQPDPQTNYLAALAQREQSEAVKNAAEIAETQADTRKTLAETARIMRETQFMRPESVN